MAYNKHDLKGIGDVYGALLNGVKREVRQLQEKCGESCVEEIGVPELVGGGPEGADGFEKPTLDTHTMSERDRVANMYKMDDLSEDEEDEEDDESSDEAKRTAKEARKEVYGSDTSHVKNPWDKKRKEEDEENLIESKKNTKQIINNIMRDKKHSFSFDELYESVMGGEIEGPDELNELGIDDGSDDLEGEDDTVTVSLPRDVAQQLCDALQSLLSDDGESDDDFEDGDEGFGGEPLDYEEDEERPTDKVGNDGDFGHALHGAKQPNMGTNNKVGDLKPSGGDKSGKPTDKVGNDGDHGHALHGAKQPNMGTKNRVGNLTPGKRAFD